MCEEVKLKEIERKHGIFSDNFCTRLKCCTGQCP